jgi:hypothetical protein
MEFVIVRVFKKKERKTAIAYGVTMSTTHLTKHKVTKSKHVHI